MNEMTDAALARRARQGDEVADQVLLARYQSDIIEFVDEYIRGAEVIEAAEMDIGDLIDKLMLAGMFGLASAVRQFDGIDEHAFRESAIAEIKQFIQITFEGEVRAAIG